MNVILNWNFIHKYFTLKEKQKEHPPYNIQ